MTALQLITRALRTIGSLAAGETPTAEEADDCLTILNEMVSAWGTQRQTIFVVARNVYPVTNLVQTYTIGPGATWDQARPLWIQDAGIIQLNNSNTPLELPMQIWTVDQWAAESLKQTQSALPMALYYDYGFSTTGRGTVSLWPVPSVGTLNIALYTPTALTQFANLATPYTFPPGYDRALRLQLAVELAPEFGRPIDPTLAALAEDAFADIKRANTRLMDLTVDEALLRRSDLFNWYTGEPL